MLSIVYRSLGYFDVVLEAAEASMSLAVHEIQELHYYPESGEVHVHVYIIRVEVLVYFCIIHVHDQVERSV